MEKKLYPLKVGASRDSWGVEDLVVANGWLEGNAIADIMETYLERVVGENVFKYYGRWFPLMVKFTDVDRNFPLRVHPDDLIAEEIYDSLGKAECWYVLDAEPGSKIFMGFNRDVTAQEFYDRCLNGTVEELLNVIYPKKGDMIYVAPGTVHSLDAGIKLLEIQENSDLNFLLYDWNGEGDSDLAEAIDIINYKKYVPADAKAGWERHFEEHDCHCNEDGHDCKCGDDCHCTDDDHECHCNGKRDSLDGQIVETLVELPEFCVTKLKLTDPLHIYTEKFGSFIIYACVEGAASIQVPSTRENGEAFMDNYEFTAGETMLIPAEMPDFYLVPRDRSTVILETLVRVSDELDSYINPNTEAFLEDEDYEGLENGLLDDSDDEDVDSAAPKGASPLNFFS